MVSYTVLRRGDRLPTVGVLQKLLNRSGAKLKIDCAFGDQTNAALTAFQRPRGIQEDSITGPETWRRLLGRDSLPIADCVDVFDENLYNKQAQSVLQTGQTPLFIGGMSDGLAQAAADLSVLRGLFLLRFIGHGCPGTQGVGIGIGGWLEQRAPGQNPIPHFFRGEHSRIKGSAANASGWTSLRAIFGPYASVELHGCHVGGGKVGRTLVNSLAEMLRVPVSASPDSQRQVLRFDGQTYTAWPPGFSPSSWGARLQDFTPYSVL